MPLELFQVQQYLPVFMLVAGRLAGMIMFQPILGALSIPARIRILLVAGLAALVTPVLTLPGQMPDTPAELAIALGQEALLGALIGLVVRIVFFALELAGLMIAQESGLAFAQIADPSSGAPADVLSMVYVQLGAVVFLVLGGHRALLGACLDTFTTVPLLGAAGVVAAGAGLIPEVLALGTQVAVRVAAPVVLTLFLVNVVMGFLGRVAPQLNVTVLGFSLKGMLVFVMAAISLPAAMEVFVEALEAAGEAVRRVSSGELRVSS